MYQSLIDEDREDVDPWGRTDIHLPPKSIARITTSLKSAGVSCQTMIHDVQALVDAERIPSPAGPDAPNPDPFFDTYRPFTEVHNWYRTLATNNSNLATFTQLNTTYENRPIMILKVETGAANKPVIFIEGGIHSREWISITTVAYLAAKVLGTDNDAVQLRAKYNWHFVPIVNGDGYVYTWGPDRMWRKTRKPNPGATCVGTDPNRNWDDHWCQQGGSTNPCSDSFCGSAAFTERETFSMANHIIQTGKTATVRMFIDYHAYGQLWMAPWGWSGAIPPDGAAQQAIGTTAVNAIRSVNNLTYRYGTIYNIIYPASGSSADYAYDFGKVIYAYGVELRDTGTYGFQLPANQIRPQGEEIWNATVAMARQMP